MCILNNPFLLLITLVTTKITPPLTSLLYWLLSIATSNRWLVEVILIVIASKSLSYDPTNPMPLDGTCSAFLGSGFARHRDPVDAFDFKC